MQRGIKRSLRDAQRVARHLLNALGNGPAVLRLEGQNLEDQQVERPLWHVNVLFRHSAPLRLLQEQANAFLVEVQGEGCRIIWIDVKIIDANQLASMEKVPVLRAVGGPRNKVQKSTWCTSILPRLQRIVSRVTDGARLA